MLKKLLRKNMKLKKKHTRELKPERSMRKQSKSTKRKKLQPEGELGW